MKVNIDDSWKKHLSAEFEKEYFYKLTEFVREEYRTKTIYPPPKLIFNAFDSCKFEDVKVVILGQDPYHNPKQANGLSFSVPSGVAIPPSLLNIFKEIKRSVGAVTPNSGELLRWTEQGVLLLNATLTVEANRAGSHQGRGWEQFTDSVIDKLSKNRDNIVFLLWGNYAKQKEKLIDSTKHLILKSAHPSPLSAHRGFIGNNHFLETNKYLNATGQTPIDW